VAETANEEPPEGTSVIDAMGRRWVRDDGFYGGDGWANWVLDDDPSVHESWVKVSGNYGPVTVEAYPS